MTNTRAIAEQVEDIELLPKGKLFPPRLEIRKKTLTAMVWGKRTSFTATICRS